jgi:hypothetical protein
LRMEISQKESSNGQRHNCMELTGVGNQQAYTLTRRTVPGHLPCKNSNRCCQLHQLRT